MHLQYLVTRIIRLLISWVITFLVLLIVWLKLHSKDLTQGMNQCCMNRQLCKEPILNCAFRDFVANSM